MSTRPAAKPTRAAPAVRPVARPAVRLPLEHYRLLAGALLVILLGITVLAPLGVTPLPAPAVQAPALTGTTDAFAQIFDYRAVSQRVSPGTPPAHRVAARRYGFAPVP